jgi:predicted RNA-binding protein with PUA-like domain
MAKSADRRFWLFKSEPGTYSFAHLQRDRRTGWGGVRNFQARNLLRDEIAVGDGVLFYHSSAEPPGVAGIARVVRAGHPDPTQFDARSEYFDPEASRDAPRWFQVEIEAQAPLPRLLPLAELRRDPALAKMVLLQRGARLSVQPVRPEEWRRILEVGGMTHGGPPGYDLA